MSLNKIQATYQHQEDLALRSGDVLPGYQLAYETYGELNAEGSNAILLFHALTGSQNATGHTEVVTDTGKRWNEECQEGWWSKFIGDGLAIDTSDYYIICANYIGGCYGSSGPSSSLDSKDSFTTIPTAPLGSAFPRITMSDIVDSQLPLLKHLGISKLHAVVGCSIGGMLCLSLATRYPELTDKVLCIASTLATSPLQKILNLEQIMAIEGDENFSGGDYYATQPPLRGLALARTIQHKTFFSLQTMESRAQSEVRPTEGSPLSWYKPQSSLESYMLHQGKKFVSRFDANSYLRLLDAWQQYDAPQEAGASSDKDIFASCLNQNFLQFSIDSDVCFYPSDQKRIADALSAAGVPNRHITVSSDKGHDSFLLEPELYHSEIVKFFNE